MDNIDPESKSMQALAKSLGWCAIGFDRFGRFMDYLLLGVHFLLLVAIVVHGIATHTWTAENGHPITYSVGIFMFIYFIRRRLKFFRAGKNLAR